MNMNETLEKAKQGDASAQFLVAEYFYGKKNFQQSVYWLTQAVAQGYAPAIVKLGVHYQNGVGVEQDPNYAFKLFQQVLSQKKSANTLPEVQEAQMDARFH